MGYPITIAVNMFCVNSHFQFPLWDTKNGTSVRIFFKFSNFQFPLWDTSGI